MRITTAEDAMAHDIGPILRVLGGFDLRVGPRPVRLSASGRRVLALLAIGGPALLRETLAGRVWEWSSQSRAHANLRNALWRIRRADRRLVETDHEQVRLGGDVTVDLHASVAEARRLLDRRHTCEAAADAVDLLETDILPDWDDDWVLLERERHRQLRVHALEALSIRLTDEGRFAEAIDTAYAAIAAEPLRESAHDVLIRAHLAEGNRGEATRQFAAYRRLLHDELGLPPSSRLEALVGETVRA
jgi:DNA-binding SARP family transcriptional activator